MRPGSRSAGLMLVALLGTACSAVPPPASQPSTLAPAPRAAGRELPASSLSQDQQILHVLNRLGYGPRPGDIERVRRMGVAAYIERQLSPSGIADPAMEQALAGYGVLGQSAAQLVTEYPQPSPQVRQRLAQGEMSR